MVIGGDPAAQRHLVGREGGRGIDEAQHLEHAVLGHGRRLGRGHDDARDHPPAERDERQVTRARHHAGRQAISEHEAALAGAVRAIDRHLDKGRRALPIRLLLSVHSGL